jgi:uncharacterized membrane protein YeaQ/YmgE (transglycosylase-associated protein family)
VRRESWSERAPGRTNSVTVGGWRGHVLGIYGPDQPAGLIMSVVGAMVLLGVYRVGRGRQT